MDEISKEETANYLSYLKKAIDGEISKETRIRVGQTPQVYVKYWLHNSYTIIKARLVKKVTSGTYKDHTVSIETLERLPQLIHSPVMIFESFTDESLVVVVDEQDKKGRQVIVIIRPTDEGINTIPSVYGKNNFSSFVGRTIENGKVKAANKTWVAKNLRPLELQLLMDSAFDDLAVNLLSS
jgi:hypothetical protein